MPRTTLAVQTIAASPSLKREITYSNADAVNGMEFKNASGALIIVKSTEAGSVTVTVTSVPEPRTGRLGNVVATIAQNTDHVLGPFNALDFEQAAGQVYIDFTVGGSTVKVAAVRPA